MTSSKSSTSYLSLGDRILVTALRGLAAIASAILLVIIAFLVKESIPALRSVGITGFFGPSGWHPTEGLFGLLPMLVGSVLVMAGAVAIAGPLGLLAAVFCHFYAPRGLAGALRRGLELMAGIPSVVYGFWGLVVLVPLINAWEPPGTSLLAATLVVAIMVLPTSALSADASLAAVPRTYLLAAASLGLDVWGTLRTAVLPAARPALVTGLILQAGRAIGETMAIIMVAGNIVQIPQSVFDPIRTLSANIALEMAYALDGHRSALFVSGSILVLFVSILIVTADQIAARSMRHA